jgi:preprotein translocase subunit SecG
LGFFEEKKETKNPAKMLWLGPTPTTTTTIAHHQPGRGGWSRRRRRVVDGGGVSRGLVVVAFGAPRGGRDDENYDDDSDDLRTTTKRMLVGKRRRTTTTLETTTTTTTNAAAFALLASSLPAHAFTESTAREAVSNLAETNGTLESVRLVIALSSIALILFQGPKGDGVVNTLSEKRVFSSAKNAKSAVDYVTYALIGGFIVLSAVLAVG